jgi:hypothetical protein
MEIKAEVVLDSINPWGERLTTFEITLPYIYVLDFNTHRAFSRNSASARAVPMKEFRERAIRDPYFPVEYRENGKGMVAGELMNADRAEICHAVWHDALLSAALSQQKLEAVNLHKQWTNRLLAPFMMTKILMSSTQAGLINYFWQRCHSGAGPEMRKAADEVQRAYYIHSKPTPRGWGEWHLPYIDQEERETHTLEALKKMSAARCCRVSKFNHGGGRSIEDDFKTWSNLMERSDADAWDPHHYSPLEHVALATTEAAVSNFGLESGWHQLRKDYEVPVKWEPNLPDVREHLGLPPLEGK